MSREQTLLDAGRKTPPGREPRETENRLILELPEDDRAALLEAGAPFTFAPGETLCESGRIPGAVEFIETGVVSAVVVVEDGHMVESYMVGREGVTHPLMRFDQPCYSRLFGQIPGSGLRVDAPTMTALARERSAIAEMLSAYSQRLMGELEQSTACNALHRTERRFAKWLLRCHDRLDGDVLNLTQEFLASMLGAQRTTVNEAAQQLQDIGAIRYSRGRIRIMDRPALEGAACECYAARGYKRRMG